MARVGAELFVKAREVRRALDFASFPEEERERIKEAFAGIARIKNAEFSETTGVDEAVARRGGFRALVDVAEAVILNGSEGGFEAARFEEKPKLFGDVLDRFEFGTEFFAGTITADGMKFEIDALAVERGERGEIFERAFSFEFAKPFLAFAATGMVLAVHGEENVAEREFGFGEVTSEEIGVVAGEVGAGELLLGVEEAGAAIHEEARGFVERDAMRRAMMVAAGEPVFGAMDESMSADEIVVEHRHRAALEFPVREEFEFDFDAGVGGESFGDVVEFGVVTFFGEQIGTAMDDIEFEVVVGTIDVAGFQHATFAATVATAEDEGVDIARAHDAENFVARAETKIVQLGFELVGAVDGETSVHLAEKCARPGGFQVETVSFR